ncbi:MAG: phage holin family protein [Candidatus Gracilibacteria bacterium]
MDIIVSLLITAVAVMVTAYILPGVAVSNFWSALGVAVVLALLNAFVRPILTALTLPINVLTLGLFTLVINAVIILIADRIIDGFKVDNFLIAVVFAIILSVINSILFSIAF